jgi:hypothetical protein
METFFLDTLRASAFKAGALISLALIQQCRCVEAWQTGVLGCQFVPALIPAIGVSPFI